MKTQFSLVTAISNCHLACVDLTFCYYLYWFYFKLDFYCSGRGCAPFMGGYMQDIHEESLNESVKSEQSPRVVLWEIDLTVQGGERYFSAMS